MPITQPNKEIAMSFHLFKEKLTIIYIAVQKLKKAYIYIVFNIKTSKNFRIFTIKQVFSIVSCCCIGKISS